MKADQKRIQRHHTGSSSLKLAKKSVPKTPTAQSAFTFEQEMSLLKEQMELQRMQQETIRMQLGLKESEHAKEKADELAEQTGSYDV